MAMADPDIVLEKLVHPESAAPPTERPHVQAAWQEQQEGTAPSNPNIARVRLEQLESDWARDRHEKAYARRMEDALRSGCGPLKVLLWAIAFPPLLLLALLNLPVVVIYSLLVQRLPGCLCAKRRKTEELGEWIAKSPPPPGVHCYPSPCLCWPVCCWLQGTGAPLPDVFQGVYWLEGNVVSEDFLTFKNATWDPASRAMTKRLYGPGGWTNPVTWSGAFTYWLIRLVRMEVDFVFIDDELRDGYLVFRGLGLEAPYCLLGMTIHRIADDGSLWFRKNHSGTSEYCALRVLNSDGSKTEAFAELVERMGKPVAEGGEKVAIEQYTGKFCCDSSGQITPEQPAEP